MRDVLLGDIVLERGDNLLSKGILEAQRRRGEGKSVINHAGLIVEAGNPLKAQLIESMHTTVVRPLSCLLDAQHSVIVLRNSTLCGADRLALVTKALEYKDRRYGYHILVAHLFDYFFGGRYVFRKMCKQDNYPICSWVVSFSYNKIGCRFLGLEPNLVQPDDIWDHIMANLNNGWEIV